MPAITGQAAPPQSGEFRASTLEDWKVEHFGQVLPIEDFELVIDRVDSITRIPCGCRFLSTGLTDRLKPAASHSVSTAVDKVGFSVALANNMDFIV